MSFKTLEDKFSKGTTVKNIYSGKVSTVKQTGCTSSTLEHGLTIMIITEDDEYWESYFVEVVEVKKAPLTITAINKTYQSSINKAYKAYRSYHALINLDGTFETDRDQLTNERQAERQHDKYYNLFSELPKREQQSFERQHNKLHGYK